MTDKDTVIEFGVVGGICRLRFASGASIGRDNETNPGIAFEMIAESGYTFMVYDKRYAGKGVVSRSDAKRLADMIYKFLAAHEAAG